MQIFRIIHRKYEVFRIFSYFLFLETMFSLEAKIRTTTARETREEGLIPAVVYGKDVPSTMIAVGVSEFIKVYRESGKSQIITLTVDGKKYNTLVQEAQRHPVRGDFLHLDFININMKEKIEVNIPVVLVGEAPAAMEGGQVSQLLNEITVKCLPADIVEAIEVDISEVKIGDTLHISDLKISKNFEIMNHEEEAVVSGHEIKVIEEEETPVEAEGTEESPKSGEATDAE